MGNPSGKFAKHTVTANKNKRSHVMLVLFLLVSATYIWVLFFSANKIRGESHIQCNANPKVATLAARLG